MRTRHEPDHEGPDRNDDHGRYEVARHLVGKLLDRRLRCLRLLDQLDDLGKHGVGAHPSGSHPKCPRLVDGGSDHGIAHPLADRDRLAGDHRLVNRGVAVDDLAVDRDPLPRSHCDNVPRHNLGDRDLGLHTVADEASGTRLQADQLADRLPGPGLRSDLDQPAKHDQSDDHADCLEVNAAQVGRKEAGRQGDQQAVGEGGGGADSYKRVHLG